MKKLFGLLLFFSLTASAKDVLTLFNWNNAVAPETIKQFESHCHCTVKQIYYGSMEEMLAKLSAGAKGFDVMGPANYGLTPLIKQKMIIPLDHQQLPNIKNLDKRFINTPLDRGNRYSIPYDFTVTLIGYNRQKIDELKIAPTSWSIIFEPSVLQKLRGKVTVLDDSHEVIAAALLYNGFSANSRDPKALAKAKETILKAKPYWAAFNSQSYIKALTTGDIWVALGYSNDMYQAQTDARAANRNFAIDYALQKEGNSMTIDSFVVSKDTKNIQLSHQFINFMLEGKNAAQITNRIGAGSPNAAALPFIPNDLQKREAINPSSNTLKKLEQLTELDGRSRREWSHVWTSIKIGK